MEKPTRWQLLIKSLKYNFLPFTLVRHIRVITQSGKEYQATDQDGFKQIVERINTTEPHDNIVSIVFEFKNRKIKKEVHDFSRPLFEKYFPTKPKD